MSGSVYVPPPSDLNFDFDRLTFTCRGGLDSAELANPAEQTLAYWKTKITPYSLSFAAPKGCQPPSAGFLAVGVAAKLPSLTDTPLTGTLGFGADGDLLSAGDALTVGTGITSRLTPPPNLTFKAAGTKTWKFTPTTKVYLNDWSLRPSDAGSLDLLA